MKTKISQSVRLFLLIWLASAIFAPCALGRPEQPPKESLQGHALLVSGINRDAEEHAAKEQALNRFAQILKDAWGPVPGNIHVLVDCNSVAPSPVTRSTGQNLQKTLKYLSDTIAEDDLWVFYYTGQANILTDQLRLNLPGPDITHRDLAVWLDAIKARRQLIILDCPGAGLAVKILTAPGRVIICGARSDQPYSTVFSDYFLPALRDSAAESNGRQHRSVLEAFRVAAQQIDEWYRRENRLKTENALLEDDGDGIPSQSPWEYEQQGKDGAIAAEFYLELAGRAK